MQGIPSKEAKAIYFIPPLSLILSLLPQFIFGSLPTIPMDIFFGIVFIISLILAYLLSRDKFLRFLESKANQFLLLFTLIYALFFLILNFIWFDNFTLRAGEITTFSQMIWTTIKTPFILHNSYEDMPQLGVHNCPFLFLLTPFYFIWAHSKMLIILKVISLSFSALILYKIVRFVHSRSTSLLLSVSFLLYLTIISQMSFEFAETNFFPLILFLVYYFWQKKKFLLHILFLLLCLSIREEVSAIVFMFGLYSLIKKRGPKWVLFPIVLGVAWGLFSYIVVIPFFSRSGAYLHNSEVFGGLLRLDLKSVISKENIEFLYWLLGPLLIILPFFSWEWILALPVLFGSLYLGNPGVQHLGFHYQTTSVPLLFLSLSGGLNFISEKLFKIFNPQRTKLTLAFSVLLLTVTFTGIHKMDEILHFKKLTNTPRQVLEDAIKLIPSNASVLAPLYVTPHLANRVNVFYAAKSSVSLLPDFILLDTTTNHYSTKKDINQNQCVENRIKDVRLYKKIYDRQGVKLYKRQTLKD